MTTQLRTIAAALAFGGAAACGFATPASATIVDVTYTGTVSSGGDSIGVFGLGPDLTDLTGFSFVSHYTFDTSVGIIVTSPTLNENQGGSYFGNTSPSICATLTINGHTVSITGNDIGYILGGK